MESVQVLERLADGLAKPEERKAARRAAQAAQLRAVHPGSRYAAGAVYDSAERDFAVWAASAACNQAWTACAFHAGALMSDPWLNAQKRENIWQAKVLREIVGNPFRPVVLDPAWLSWREGTVRKLAQAIYDERRFADLPILADALEDTGCTNLEILTHCRQPADHVRGCWLIDLLLGRELVSRG
jgi:hypothetical protein